MGANNQHSATLTASLGHSVQQTDENENFIAKLKKKLTLKKRSINTGACANVSGVSFKIIERDFDSNCERGDDVKSRIIASQIDGEDDFQLDGDQGYQESVNGVKREEHATITHDVETRISDQCYADNITNTVGVNVQAGFTPENSQDVDTVEKYDATDQKLTDNTDKVNVTEVGVANVMTSQKLQPVVCVETNPSLYEDTEPTHMTLSETMGWSVDTFNVDHSTINCSSPQTIPDVNSTPESAITPPPRPPPLSQQTERNEAVTSIDEDSSSESDVPDECAPAISHRDRPVKHPGYSQDFTESMRKLKDCGWYWGPLSLEETARTLANQPDGAFLMRDSSNENYILSLSYKHHGKISHSRIGYSEGKFDFEFEDIHGNSSIYEFIQGVLEHSRSGRYLHFENPNRPGIPICIQLLKPVSRFTQMRSLQHMCRFQILHLVRRDHIDHLPLPTKIKQYLKEVQYYVEYLDD